MKIVLKKAVCWKFCKTCGNISMTEFTVKEATVFRVATFLNKALRKIEFLRNLLNIQHNQQ